MAEVVSLDIARIELEKWLDYKKVSEAKKESSKESIDLLVDAISNGSLVLADNLSLIQTLDFPIKDKDGRDAYKTLEFKPRLTVGDVHSNLQGIKATDAAGFIIGYVAALISQPKEFVRKLDVQDYGIAQAIALFFV